MKTLDLAITSLVLLTPAIAQSIDGEIVRNADDTVTYTVDLDGPPNSLSVLYVSPFLANPLPTPFGPLFLDPFLLIDLGPIPLDPNGHGGLQLTVPPGFTEGLALSFQQINLSDLGIGFVPQVLTAVHNVAAGAVGAPGPQPCNDYFAASQAGQVGKFKVGGQPGTQYTIRVFDPAGNVFGNLTVTVGANGHSNTAAFAAPQLAPGFTYEIWKDIGAGEQILRWQGGF